MKTVWIAAALIAFAGCVGTIPVSSGSASLVASAPENAQVDQLLNDARASAGLAAVQPSAQLNQIAQSHADDMVRRGYFSHTSPDGVGLGGRLSGVGLRSCAAAENIAFGQNSASGAMASWMASAPHRANILKRGVTAYGVGQSADTWVLVLIQPC